MGWERKDGLLPLSHLSPCPSQLWREPGTQGPSPGRHLVFFIPLWHVPPGGRAAAVAQLQALGFINNAAQRWGPTQPPVTLGHPVWCLQLAVLWQSPLSPFQPTLPLLLCELGPEALPLWAVPGAKEWKNPETPVPFVPPPSPHRLTVSWLSKSR